MMMMQQDQPSGGNAGPAWLNPDRQTATTGAAAAGQPPQPMQISAPEDHEAALFSDATYSTLNEPVRETIMRDIMAVVEKLKIVLQPMDRSSFSPFTILYSTVAASEAASDHQSSNTTTNADGQSQPSSIPPQQPPAFQLPDMNAMPDAELSENDRFVIRRLKDWDLWGPLILCLSLSVLLSMKAPSQQAATVFAAVFCSVWAGGTVITINAQLLGGTISFFQSLCVMGYSTFPLVIAAFVIGCLKLIFHTWIWIDLIFVVLGFAWSTRVSSIFISLYIKQERRSLALYPVFFFYTFLGWLILLF
jgi:hypothetical protein